MNGNHYELEHEMKRRQINIERGVRDAWKFHEVNRNVKRAKKTKLKITLLNDLLQMLRK